MSISAFFPAYNDADSLPELLARTFGVLPRLTSDYEVIVVNDGSTDHTATVLDELARCYGPQLTVITHKANRGYGAALQSGFSACTKEAIFYTDGDGQYDVCELEQLWAKWRPDIDLVNGYKLNRADGWVRGLVGHIYNWAVRGVFHISIRDVDCDFRLIRRSVLARTQLCSDGGAICVELVGKLQRLGSGFAEVGVHHYARKHGHSQFFRLKPIFDTFYQLFLLYTSLPAEAAYAPESAD